MNRFSLSALLMMLSTTVALAQDAMPPGLTSAKLLPGWVTKDGTRMIALDLVLEPGWKTYWRKPGDSGIPPSFDWSAGDNIADATVHWPAPEVIVSGGDTTMGFHDRLTLPIELHPQDPAQPMLIASQIMFGLCENICVPANLSLTTGQAGTNQDPAITAALAAQPRVGSEQPDCEVAEIGDGLRLTAHLPVNGTAQAVAIELSGAADVWISGADVAGATATADLVPPERAPFDLDLDALIFTLIDDDGAVELHGCAPNS